LPQKEAISWRLEKLLGLSIQKFHCHFFIIEIQY
jgi:hypothetical protein